MILRSETGLVLIVILIVISLSSLGSIHFLDQQIILVKMLGCLKQQAQDLLMAENRLLEAEGRVLKNPEHFIDKAAIFVPDHLAFGCDQGRWLIGVEAAPFQSFVAVRAVAPSEIEYATGSALKPIVIKRTGGSWNRVFSVYEDASGILRFLDLQTQRVSSVIVPGGAVLSLTPVDQGGRGVCDALYIANAEGLWLLPLGLSEHGEIQRILRFAIHSKIIVLPHGDRRGLELYFLGHRAGTQGLWRVVVLQADPAKMPVAIPEAQCVVEGVFRNVWVRAGRVILLPDSMAQHPLVWDVPTQRLESHAWKTVFSNEGLGAILGAQLAWDPERQEEKVIVVNSQGQTTTFATPLHRYQQGCLAFRKL
ncbi:MAG: hypothetical protein KA508_02280 [Gammaproteobacteria bacterium]|nr:hypothetical protein [Gammaproteobacteria bacterium]